MANEPTAKARVLVIDDGLDELEVLDILLTREGYAVDTADNGRTGLEVARAKVPDLVLLDLHMPGLDGFQVLEQLKGDARLAEASVIVVSGSTVERDIVRALELGATDYVAKPYAVEILLARVRAALRSRREKQALHAAQEELARVRRGAAIGAIAAGLAHEINNPAAFVVTDLHEVRELARDLAEAGDEERSETLLALAEEALLGMHRIRDVVRDLAVFSSIDNDSAAPASGFIDLVEIVKRRAQHFGGRVEVRGHDEPALVPGGGGNELDALIGLLIRHGSSGDPDARVVLRIEREPRAVSVHVEGAREASDALSLTIARELAERFGGTLATCPTEGSWTLRMPAFTSG